MNWTNLGPRRVHCFLSQLIDATKQPTYEEDDDKDGRVKTNR